MSVRDAPATRVPFVDLAPAHAGVKDGILGDLAGLIDSGDFTNGPAVAAFERAFAAYVGTRHAVGTASGLDALRLGLIAAGCRPGDEVIVPANCFVAALEAISQAGGEPVLVDAGTGDYNIDVRAAEAAVGSRTRFLLPVHLYGQMADMRALRDVARRHALTVVEDACQAHGAVRDGIRAGTAGHAAAFSFYPGKNLGAMGDGGALTTGDAETAAIVRALREHGQRHKHMHELEGYTARLDTLQAVVLARKLPLLDGWNAERAAIARAYGDAMTGVGDLRLPPVPEGSEPVWHLYVVRTADPGSLADFLRARGIATGRHYPVPPHLCPAYAWLGHRRGSFPVTEALAAELLSLPVFPGMTEAQVAAVADGVRAYFA